MTAGPFIVRRVSEAPIDLEIAAEACGRAWSTFATMDAVRTLFEHGIFVLSAFYPFLPLAPSDHDPRMEIAWNPTVHILDMLTEGAYSRLEPGYIALATRRWHSLP